MNNEKSDASPRDLGAQPIALPDTADRATRFFTNLATAFRATSDCRIVLVTHILPDRPPFLRALSRFGEIAFIVPKPNSIHAGTRELLEQEYRIIDRTREELGNFQSTQILLDDHVGGDPFVILDIGGYFARVADQLAEHYGDQLLGIVEDTENGLQRYEEHYTSIARPIYSVARSPLKEPEDHLVGESVVFSMERLIRRCGEVLFGRRAVVFGYGKVGRSAARALTVRGVRVSVVDSNSVRAVEAQAHGFRTVDKRTGLATADLILGATGNFSLKSEDFLRVKNGTFIASVTSSDDELDMSGLPDIYEVIQTTQDVTCYSKPGQFFYLLCEGNAVNFIDGAVVGPYIYLVQGEIMAAVAQIKLKQKERSSNRAQRQIEAVPTLRKKVVGDAWLEQFNDEQSGSFKF